MKEHEKLKFICEKILCKIDFYKDYDGDVNGYGIMKDVREIIFTSEFMTKYNKYRVSKIMYGINAYPAPQNSAMGELLNYLDDPVTYLYNLLELGE